MKTRYALGLDFGTESVRAMLVDTQTGKVAGDAVVKYRHGVITDVLPDSGVRLKSEWALQHPRDYLDGMAKATRRALRMGNVKGEDVCGIGISFTACTMLPTTWQGDPLCFNPRFARKPNAWCKLWKHHASQPQADKINETARRRNVAWLARYGGIVSSEWFFPKALQTLEEEPEVYRAADVFIEAGEWIVWRLTDQKIRSTCHGGYKQCWHKQEGYPSKAFWQGVHPKFGGILDKMSGPRLAPGQRAGILTETMARQLGLRPGVGVSSSIIDAHAGVPGAGVTGPDVLVMVMGTSTCHMLMSDRERLAEGISGVVEDGILPGYFGYEAGQVAVGDIFAWYVAHSVPGYVEQAAAENRKSIHTYLMEQAEKIKPGQSGLLALDWWNGNRTPFVDANLSGLIVGLTLASRPAEIYRALIEATAFGTLRVIDTFAASGVKTKSLVACGGIAQKNPMLMQIYADVTGRPIQVAASSNASSLGAAILGAVAAGKLAGGHDTVAAAVRRICQKPIGTYRPKAGNHKTYVRLYAEYKRLSDAFGRYRQPAMQVLRDTSRSVAGG
jgi:L-ribulokinase